MVRQTVFLAQMQDIHPFDENRIYMNRHRHGWTRAYKLACVTPETFAAVAICCGRAGVQDQPEQLLYVSTGHAEKPVRLLHGLSDRAVVPNHALRAVEKLQRNPTGDFCLTQYPAVGCGCYVCACPDDGLYTWTAFRRNDEER